MPTDTRTWEAAKKYRIFLDGNGLYWIGIKTNHPTEKSKMIDENGVYYTKYIKDDEEFPFSFDNIGRVKAEIISILTDEIKAIQASTFYPIP